MSKPVFQDLFTFQHRRDRKSYWQVVLFMFIGISFLATAEEILAQYGDEAPSVILPFVLLTLLS
ncbi:hypothetical protein PUV47_19475 [Pseudovibrio exalbescens]|uniref:hypothetical protein n=1 Tax=Pseudovibrio exalbescens TaxID=197461 RepID=UPI0023652379|nr:hypothetical protein [Pseudovibrio exalbescens]MDD7912118.1 hypothetical protein [Pseudovibrio exalbescens]